jgi:hypothetical protein
VKRYGLNFVSRLSKVAALATVIFLLSSTLDNVPDCPELLNSNPGSTILSLVHHCSANSIDTRNSAWEAIALLEICVQRISDGPPALSPSLTQRSLYQAADPSPPLA